MVRFLRTVLAAAPLVLACGALAGCAGQSGKATSGTPQASAASTAEDHPYKGQRTPRCQSGHTLQCEVRRTGRIRFSGFAKKNLENCACVPFEGAPLQSAIPGLERAH